MIEYVAVGLGVIAGISGVLAWFYHRGFNSGLDNACETRIKDKIEEHMKEDEATHKEIFAKIDRVESKIDVISGSFDIIKAHITKQP